MDIGRTGSFHVYVDQTGFRYEVPMTHITFLNDDNNTVRTKKYTLYVSQLRSAASIAISTDVISHQLFETNAFPYLYKWGARLNDGKKKAAFHRDGCLIQMHFDKAFEGFRDFYRKKTGVNWDERCDGIVIDDETKFRYSPPDDGKPVGMLPPGWMKAKEVDEDEESDESSESSDEETTSEESDDDQSTITLRDEEPPAKKHRRRTPSPSPLEHPYQFAVRAA